MTMNSSSSSGTKKRYGRDGVLRDVVTVTVVVVVIEILIVVVVLVKQIIIWWNAPRGRDSVMKETWVFSPML